MNVIDLFCGCGGFSKGFEQAGFNVRLGIDIWQDAVTTYKENFPNAATIVGDISGLTGEDLLSAAGITADEVDVIIGGPPCQGFSLSGKRMLDDPRNVLYKSFVRMVATIQPKAFVMENVPGLVRLFNAADYGVPQKRERVIIVGIRKDIWEQRGDFIFPAKTNDGNWVPLSVAVPELAIKEKKYYFSERAVQGMKNAKNNMKRGLAQNLDEPCLTVTSHLAKVSLNSRDPVLLVDPKKELYRRFTPLEAARIQSFPDDFVFAGTETTAYKQIGNAIPPVLFWHITDAIVKYLGE